MNEHSRQDNFTVGSVEYYGLGGSDMGRLEFIDCPLCAGHEKIGADTANALHDILAFAATEEPEHVRAELENIINAIRNAKELGRPERALAADPLLD